MVVVVGTKKAYRGIRNRGMDTVHEPSPQPVTASGASRPSNSPYSVATPSTPSSSHDSNIRSTRQNMAPALPETVLRYMLDRRQLNPPQLPCRAPQAVLF